LPLSVLFLLLDLLHLLDLLAL
jgi:hypothetical protein